MTTAAPPPLTQLARDWEALDDYPSAVFSGIIPDLDHLENGGYHVSIEDLARWGNDGDYSNTRDLDRSPPVTYPDGRRYSAAMDMSMAPADMRTHYLRVRAVYDDGEDPRRAYLGYVNCWDGQSSSATRLDFQGNRVLTASADHKWHVHTDFPRAYVDIHLDPAQVDRAMAAYLSVIKGETKQEWAGEEDDVRRLLVFRFTDGAGHPYWSSWEGSGIRTRLDTDADVRFLLDDPGANAVLFPDGEVASDGLEYPWPDLADEEDWNPGKAQPPYEVRVNARLGVPAPAA